MHVCCLRCERCIIRPSRSGFVFDADVLSTILVLSGASMVLFSNSSLRTLAVDVFGKIVAIQVSAIRANRSAAVPNVVIA